jgi:hypothetical protein
MTEYPQRGMVIVERRKDATPMKVTSADPWYVRGHSLAVGERPRRVPTDKVRARYDIVSRPKGMGAIEWWDESTMAAPREVA